MIVRAINFLLFSSLFIAGCAAGMAYQTCLIFGVTPNTDFIIFLFFGTLCSYNFHWFLTPGFYGGNCKTRWSIRNKNLHLSLFLISLCGAIMSGGLLLKDWPWLLLTAFISFLYSAPKIPLPLFKHLQSIAIGKTIFLSVVWTHSTVILPLLIDGTNLLTNHWVFAISQFFFIYAICILFDLKDKEEDKKEGIKSLITYLPNHEVHRLFWVSILISCGADLCLLLNGFSYDLFIALLIPLIVLALISDKAKNTSSDYFYYFVLDGLMVFSALIIFVMRF